MTLDPADDDYGISRKYTDLYTIDNFSIKAYLVPKDEEMKYMFGDVNGDGSTNNKDVVELFSAVSGDPSDRFIEALADINKDGWYNNKDVVSLFRYVSTMV